MDSVRVAVRVRPLVPSEMESGCRPCLDVLPDTQQIVTKLKRDKFTFNYVFDSNTPQVDVYENAIQDLVKQLFKGYNVTVLAYGQTGSGKTFSMGTCPATNTTDIGIIPRAIDDIFNVINNDEDWVFNMSVSFLELYNEQLIDLLSNKANNMVDLRESPRGILIPGLTLTSTGSAADVLHCLHQGSLSRTTGATAMNAQSSRSHAIFTIYINQTRKNNEDDSMSAKFHLVDLAGSERSKKTKAEGKRFLEGVSINKELFVLGNVISALCDGAPFVNYRDSKLTRLLQDSLGGNALTLMLACVSPADSNLEETINTLRYADRARKIKNKPVVNQDPQRQEINNLKRKIEDLQLALLSRQDEKSCPPEHQELLEKTRVLMEKNKLLRASLDSTLTQTASLLERAQMAEAASDKWKQMLAELSEELDQVMVTISGEPRAKLETFKLMLTDLKNTHERSECERLIYEEQHCFKTPQPSPGRLDQGENGGAPEEEDEESNEEYVLQQAKLNKEIQELSKDLVWKEQLVAKLAENNTMVASIKPSDEEDIMELKTQIESLLQEKNELEQQLKSHRSANIDHKLAEQRRKRVKELEEKISNLNKKIVDQDRIIKMKERNEEKIKTLNNEIMSMKQIKVKLINQMKTESEKYRQWKSTREQEVCKLRSQNRQKETKFVKMETYYQKQQNVFKQKLQESAAVIKRLKETLALQKTAKHKKTLLGNAERVNQWVNQEFSAMINTLEAERTLENLVDDRTMLAKELTRLQESCDNTTDEEEKEKLNSDIKSLNEDLELRSTQIVDLKQKLQSLDSYQDNKPKSRFECIQTMADAKIALKYVFETANSYISEMSKDKASKETALNELQETYLAVVAQLHETEDLLRAEIQKLKKAELDHNEKHFVLLRRLNERKRETFVVNSPAPLHDSSRHNISTDESTSHEKIIEAQQNRIKELEEQLEKRKPKARQTKRKNESKWNAVITPETQRKFFEEEDDDIEYYDDDNDPEWKNTPIYRRLQSMRADSRASQGGAVKRNISGQPCCRCKGSCSTNSCPCRKMGAVCSGNCKCLDANCKNKVKQEDSEESFVASPKEEQSDEDDISFKKPRLVK